MLVKIDSFETTSLNLTLITVSGQTIAVDPAVVNAHTMTAKIQKLKTGRSKDFEVWFQEGSQSVDVRRSDLIEETKWDREALLT